VTRAPLTPPHQPSGYAAKSHVSVHELRRNRVAFAAARYRGARATPRRGASVA
jgi:hypothetical protein